MIKYSVNEVAFHITTCCSHRCPFCYALGNDTKQEHQSHEILSLILNELYKENVKSVLFVGGDPASHPNIVELAEHAKDMYMETTILSNTLNFKILDDNRIRNAFNSIETTIHSHIPEVHNKFCGGIFDAYQNSINRLKRFSHNGNTGVVLNITPLTYQFLYQTVQNIIEIEKVNLDHIVLQRIAPVGRANNSSVYELTKEMVNFAFQQIEKIENDYSLNVYVEDTYPLCAIENKYHKYIRPCSWGYDKCSIDKYGNIAKCCTDPDYKLGNILKQSLNEIWNFAPELIEKRNNKKMPISCTKCLKFNDCRGGCILACEKNNWEKDYLAEGYKQ